MKVRKKKRELSKEAHYKNIISKQKQTIQELRKQVSRGNKAQQLLESYEPEDEDDFIEIYEDTAAETDVKCPKCGKGSLVFVDLNVRKLFTCSTCDYRKATKS